ncbi:14463_t:CDS:2 [Funneliformis geosporum]|uniref:14463_t:CDS:1 n=1 Tax=Funneliformis geosporum TaxID=1117311 RepID=A0A9W4SQD1_9GLOM|nr:14463_t:CDS:2 [Funneliformis geosporum]
MNIMILKDAFALFILFQLFQLSSVNCQKQRYLHTATFIDNKLYILGGNIVDKSTSLEVGREFFYLDCSLPINTQKPLWQDLTSVNIIPTHAFAATVKGGANNNTLIFYGGRNLTNAENMALVYMFDTQTSSWYIPSISGVSFTKRRSLSAFIDYNKKMYLFGGWLIGGDFVNDMLILDTVNLTWGKGSSLNAPLPRINYGAVLLPSQDILYLGLDGQQVIMFGGWNENNISTADSLYTLNLSTFRWQIPNVSGKLPNSRYYHRANVIGKYMVISFDQNGTELRIPGENMNTERVSFYAATNRI